MLGLSWALLRGLILLCILVPVLASFAAAARAEAPPLIAREILFGNPERTQPTLSPDGRFLAWIAPDAKNVLQVWVKTIGKGDARQMTQDPRRGIRIYAWAQNSKTLLYLQDKDGDENWHLHGVALDSGKDRDLTPMKNVQARITAIEQDFPDEILVSLNERDPRLHDVYRLNVESGELKLDTANPGDVAEFEADSRLQIRCAQVKTPDGGTEIRIRSTPADPWKSWMKVGPEENLDFIGFSADGQWATLRSSLGTDTARVLERNIASGEEKVLAASDEVDAGGIFIHPKRKHVQAVSFSPGRTSWKIIDPSVKADFEAIGRLSDGDFSVVNRDRADLTWLVGFTSDRGPVRYYAWDRKAQHGTFLFVHQPRLEGLQLAAMKPIVIKSRDGLALHAYLTLPVGVAAKNLPMVLYVHGGPWARDAWGYHPYAQWLANRGYACLQVNFRGSVGYGKKFLNAGNKQWGLKMHDDLIDAVNWVVKEGIADPKRVAIAGGSYGGYAALAGLTFTPDFFACAVDIVGPSNLKTLIASIPPYWKPIRAEFDQRMGNVDDPGDESLIRNASPLFRADRIVRPLLIGQGAHDPRVNQAESEQIVAAIEKNRGKVTYVLYPDEGHGFARPENRIDFNARMEAFLAKHLGGRAEPMKDDPYPGSTAKVRVIGG